MRGDARSRRRRWSLVGISGAALVLGAWFAGERSIPEPAPPPPVVSDAAPVAAISSPAARDATKGTDGELPEPVRRFLEATPYPSTSGRLTSDQEDLLHPNRRHERHRPIPETIGRNASDVVTWLFTADRWAYVGAETAYVRLEVLRAGRPVAAKVLTASAVREGRSGPVGDAYPLIFHADGDVLVAELALDAFRDHHGPIAVSVRFGYADRSVHEDTLRLFYTPESRIPGRLLGLTDTLREGSLVLGLDAELREPGFYRFDANLYDASGAPVAFASFKGELPAGRTSVPLEVYGKVLADAGVPGPYTVSEIRGYRFLDGGYPDREELRWLPGAFTTGSHAVGAFTTAPHTSEHELQMVALMLEDLAQGRELPVPGLPAEGAPAARTPDDDAEPEVVPPGP